MKRTFAIGDIHGGLKALKEVLSQVDTRDTDQFIFLGDYVDGWSESAQVISFLIDFEKKHQCIFIKGNHDGWCEEWLKTGAKNSIWLPHGGMETITSYAGFSNLEKKTHINFFAEMVDYHIDGQNRLYVHAGFTSMHGVLKEVHRSNFSWDRTLWEAALLLKDRQIDESDVYYPKRFTHYSEIFIGHTPTTNYNINLPMQLHKLWNIDTGAAFMGKVTMLEVETKQYWQSSQVAALYPDEKGRNQTSISNKISN